MDQHQNQKLEDYYNGISSDTWGRIRQRCVRPAPSRRCSGVDTKALANYVTALVHLIGGLALLGYAQNYYFHLRE